MSQTFKVCIVEQVRATIEYEITAESAEEGAQEAYDRWVINGEGELCESVEDRTVEVDGEAVEVNEQE